MCDYSLNHVASRPAAVGEKLVSSRFIGTASKGFRAPDDVGTAVCVLPGTEMAFAKPVVFRSDTYEPSTYDWDRCIYNDACETRPAQAVTFRQVNTDTRFKHHDAIELLDGEIIMLTDLAEGQEVAVLQMPAAPKTADEAKAQERLEVVA